MILNKLAIPFRKTSNAASASVFLILIGVTLFLLGWFLGSIDKSNQGLDLTQTIVLVILFPVLVTLIAQLTTFVVKKEAEILAKDMLSQKDEELSDMQNELTEANILAGKREELIWKVKQFVDEHEHQLDAETLAALREDLQDIIRKIEQENKAVEAIAEWLADDNNKMILMKAAFREAMTVNGIRYLDQNLLTAFRKDLYKCLVWLQQSLIAGADYKVDIVELATAIALPKGIENYEIALNYIETYPEILTRSKGSYEFRKLVRRLSGKLKREAVRNLQ